MGCLGTSSKAATGSVPSVQAAKPLKELNKYPKNSHEFVAAILPSETDRWKDTQDTQPQAVWPGQSYVTAMSPSQTPS